MTAGLLVVFALFHGLASQLGSDRGQFWPAVMFAMGPFVAVHLLLFLTLPWPLAVAAVAIRLVVVSAEPGARLPLIWMAGCATLPYLMFLVPVKGDPAHR